MKFKRLVLLLFILFIPILSLGQRLHALPASLWPVVMTAAIVVDTLEDDLQDNGNCTLREAIQAATDNTAVDACPPGQAMSPDRITFAVDGSIELLLGELRIDEDLLIAGNGRDKTLIDGGLNSRLFNFSGGQLMQLKSLTLQGGFPSASAETGSGGAIYNASATLQLDDVLIRESIAFGPFALGGAIYSEGPLIMNDSIVENCISELGTGGVHIESSSVEINNSIIRNNHIDIAGRGGGLTAVNSNVIINDSLIAENSAGSGRDGGGGLAIVNQAGQKTVTISRSVITGNRARGSEVGGGGLFCKCDLTLIDSTVADNSANESAAGGGGLAGSGKWHIARSTLSGNSALQASGGAVYHLSGMLTIHNSTISQNRSTFGGGLFLGGGAEVQHATIAQNLATTFAGGQAIFASSRSPGVAFARTIIAGNQAGPSCVHNAELLSGGYNLLTDQTCGTLQSSDLMGLDPYLDDLADGGGLTATHALLPESPAIDAAGCLAAMTTDQRGVERPQGPGCDIGAYEFESLPLYTAYLPFALNSR